LNENNPRNLVKPGGGGVCQHDRIVSISLPRVQIGFYFFVEFADCTSIVD
jgi:hypothetical protein